MSFECDNCGKNEVDQPGKWCNACQERERYEEEEAYGRWHNSAQLCMRCNNAWGPDSTDKCGAYNMPLWMVKRKRKCKYFKEIDDYYEREAEEFYDWTLERLR